MKTSRSLAVVLAAALPLGLSAACGQEDAKPLGPGERRTVQRTDQGGAEVAVELVGEGALPTDFPSDLPVYPGSTGSGSMSIPGAGLFVTLASEDAVADVLGFYREQLVAKGWRIVSESETPPSIVAAKGGRDTYIRIERAGDATRIGISLDAASR